MGVNGYDGDDVNVKGDDGSDDGAKITVTTDGAKKRLDVSANVTNFPATQVVSDGGGSITVDGTVTTTIGTISDTQKAREYSSYSPNPSSYPSIISEVSMDYSDQLMVRGQSLTDEGSFRDDFSGSALTRALTGNIQWGGNDTHVVGTGSCLFTTQVKAGDYVKKGSDPESAWTQVDYIEDDNSLYLIEGYLGTNGTSTGSVSNWHPVTATGGSLTVGSSLLTVASGTTSGQICGIYREGDYLPYNFGCYASVSQRIANQEIALGFRETYSVPEIQACFILDGTTNTTVKCRSSSSVAASDTEETTVTIPSGNTSTSHLYRIDVTATQVVFAIDNVVVATHFNHIPAPYDNLDHVATIKNTGTAASSTNMIVDWYFVSNQNQVEVTNGFQESFLVKNAPFPNTYSAAITGLVAAASATDVFTITGSATKIVEITRIRVDGTQTTASTVSAQVIKRSTANSAGTSTSPTAVSHDSAQTAATATVRAYTANPTLGTSVGVIRSDRLFVPTATAIGDELHYDFGAVRSVKPIVLRGTSEVLAINFNATTLAGSLFNISVEWMEY